ncbi:MBL fold metallo-hydrolase [Sorangium sp. So ce134]
MSHYLKPSVQIEPLVNQWHAHLFLIAPQAAALFTQAQLGILKSYLQMPMAHAAALRDPTKVGGPFIDLKGQRVAEVRALKEDTERRSQALLGLADAIKELFGLLGQRARGQPLAALYAQIPEALNGLVELLYDVRHQPGFRFFEPLLYGGPLEDASRQSVALTHIEDDQRAFIFSTPRLPGPDAVHLPLRFDSPRIDDLCRLRRQPAPLGEILERFEVPQSEQETFTSFLWQHPPRRTPAYDGDGVRMRYFGHACVLFESAGVSILIDPLISYGYPSRVERFTFEDLPPVIDYVLITHAHHDHLVLESLLQLRERIGALVVPRAGQGLLQDPSLKLALQAAGFPRVVEIDEMERLSLPNGFVQAIPFLGEHCDLNIRAKAAYLLRMAGQTAVVLADSSSVSPEVYERVRREVGEADLMLIGLEPIGAPMSWAYGPLFPEKLDRALDQQRRSNGADSASALRLAEIFQCKRVFLYAMGLEPWLGYLMALHPEHQSQSAREIEAFTSACSQRGVAVERLYAKKEIVFPSTLNAKRSNLISYGRCP